jgi:outer membrane protein assembly factor BamB
MHCAGRTLFTLAIPLTLAGVCLAADWPQYRGPNQDGKTPEAIRTDWPRGGPKVLWKIPLGPSFGSFAVRGDRAYIVVSRGGREGVLCIDANTGKEQWFTPIADKTISDRQGGDGPRTTPVIDGERVYAVGTYFNLACIGAKDGKEVWSKDLAKEYQAQNDTNGIVQWGNAMSPIVEGNLVIIAGGGGSDQTFLAFDKTSGSVAWKTGTEKVTHATPTPATIHGVRQVIFFVQSGLVSLDPKTGRELWRAPFPFNVSTASSPIVGGDKGDIVYCAAAYNMGSAAFRISKDGDSFSAKEIWRLKGSENGNHWTTPVYHDGHLYGLFGHRNKGPNNLECRELATGKVKWSQRNVPAGGATIMAGKHIILQNESGQIVVFEPTPTAFKKIAEAQPLKGKAWTMAVISDGRLFARTDKEGVCLDVAPERSAGAR